MEREDDPIQAREEKGEVTVLLYAVDPHGEADEYGTGEI
jgi:hypothetical protein